MNIRRRLKIPGMVTGLVTGMVVGALLSLGGASIGLIFTAALGLGIPLALFGMGYDELMDAGKLRFGSYAPACLYGILTFPFARLIQELLLTAVFGQGITLQQESSVFSFLAFQAIMGFGYGFGFLWIHTQIMEIAAWYEYRKHVREGKEEPLPAARRRT